MKCRVASASFGLLVLSLISGCFLVSSNTLAGDTVIDDVFISVDTSCNFNHVVTSAHAADINIGTYRADIGTTTFNVFCNDNGGFSIYAIGYSGAQDGNTKLLANIDGMMTPIYDIVTGTATSGNTSNWAMKLSAVSGTYAPTISNGSNGTENFTTYHAVPSTSTKVATFSSSTAATIGSSLQSTYAVFISATQPAGVYAGKVKYTLVHPASETVPSAKQGVAGKVRYEPNSSVVTDNMGDQTVASDAALVELWASNFKRPGYGFAGWSTTYDYSDPAGFYGPNQTIEDSATLNKIQNEGLVLYAYWIPSAGTIQDWDGCDSLNEYEVTALTDLRDNNTYAVAKLKDTKCWMIENLRLNNTNPDNSHGALAQGYGGQFEGLANSESANFNANTTANSLYYIGTQSGTASIDVGDTDSPAYRIPRYRSSNTTASVANMSSGTNQSVYGYGNYYNWPAAKANTSLLNDATSSNGATTSLCPKGWHLPSGHGSGEFGKLSNALGGYQNSSGTAQTMSGSTTPTSAEMSRKFREYPNNFVYSGIATASSQSNRGTYGWYWTNRAASATNANYFRFYGSTSTSNLTPGNGSNSKYYGGAIRCIAGNT